MKNFTSQFFTFESKKLSFNFLMIVALACTFSVSLSAQGIPKISIQGTLKSANGASVPDGQYSVRFNLYNTAIGGTALWHEDTIVEVVGSLYSHYLGSVNPLNGADFDTTLYLGVKVGSYELTPRSELSYAPYALSVYTAQTVVCSGAVGDVKYSILNPSQFAAQNGLCWVPMDGRAMVASDKLRQVTGLTAVPNGGGLFLRSQEFSTSSDYDKSRTSGSPIATVQTEAIQSHNHGVNDPGHAHSFDDYYRAQGGTSYNISGGERFQGGLTSDNHSTYNNTTGISIQNVGGPETRPVNMNMWVYIRIN